MITICKKPGIKNCVRITTEDDIPAFLADVVHIEGDNLILDCLECEEKAPIGSVIAFEELDEKIMKEHNRQSKINVWNKANWATTTTEKDGIFYELPKPVKAVLLDENLPEEIVEKLGDNFWLENGEFYLKTDWGVSSAPIKNGYLVIYGIKENGQLDANILTVGTPSFANYYVVTQEGKLGETLQEHHAKLKKPKR